MGTSGAVKPAAVTVPPLELVEIALLALACSLPVVLIGGLIIRVSRSWSLTVSMVALVLIPTLATFSGVIGASGFMITGTFARIAVVPLVGTTVVCRRMTATRVASTASTLPTSAIAPRM